VISIQTDCKVGGKVQDINRYLHDVSNNINEYRHD